MKHKPKHRIRLVAPRRLQRRQKLIGLGLVVAVLVAGGIWIAISRAGIPNKVLNIIPSTRSGNADYIQGDPSAATTSYAEFGGTKYTVVAAGNIASSLFGNQQYTAQLVKNLNPNYVLVLGNATEDPGRLSNYQTIYNSTWGAFRNKTYPAPGASDYTIANAADYASYFQLQDNPPSVNGNPVDAGAPTKGYYAFNIGDNWRVYSLNSEANVAEENAWLAQDLAQAKNKKHCIMAYWYRSLFDPTKLDSTTDGAALKPVWQTLEGAHTDLVLVGSPKHFSTFGWLDENGKRQSGQAGNIIPSTGIELYASGTGGAPDMDGDLFVSGVVFGSSVINYPGVTEVTLRDNSFYVEYWSASNVFPNNHYPLVIPTACHAKM